MAEEGEDTHNASRVLVSHKFQNKGEPSKRYEVCQNRIFAYEYEIINDHKVEKAVKAGLYAVVSTSIH